MARSVLKFIVAASAAVLVSGCAHEEPRTDGLTVGLGNSVAHNSMLQIVDPWPQGVDDPDLDVPADRGGEPAKDIGQQKTN